jgi:Mg-chelatase subunit ChlD
MAAMFGFGGGIGVLAGVGCTGIKTSAVPGVGADGGTAPVTFPVFDALPSAADAPMRDLLTSEGPSLVGGGADAACATQSATAQVLPLDLYMMLDTSGSMVDLTASGVTKWDSVKAALTAFFNDPSSAGIGVGVQYFPQEKAGVPDSCLADAECGTSGPCDRLRSCSGGTTVVACGVDADCPKGQTCELLGACTLSATVCGPAGADCGPGDPCTAFDGYCLGRDVCDIPPYAGPAVAVAALPQAAAPIIASLAAHAPDGLTPTAPALAGAIQYARQRATANRARKTAVVLVTDGFPSECVPADIPGVAGVAATGVSGTPSIPTFVIGVFAPADTVTATMNLNALAAGGGTGQAVVINTQDNVTTMLQVALNQIRTTAVACQYQIPPPSMGAIDFNKVNVQFTASGANAQVSMVGYVRNKAGCDPVRGGWYYDVDPTTGAAPTAILACDASCTGFRANSGGRVDIVLGCQTFVVL